MAGYIKDDRRYMTHEVRAIDDARYRGEVKYTGPAVRTCYCGKTVIETGGRKHHGVECPRGCEAHRPKRGAEVVTAFPARARAMGFIPKEA